jgi:hypothetical protein
VERKRRGEDGIEEERKRRGEDGIGEERKGEDAEVESNTKCVCNISPAML